jgi:hypothetical protein
MANNGMKMDGLYLAALKCFGYINTPFQNYYSSSNAYINPFGFSKSDNSQYNQWSRRPADSGFT